MRPRIIAAAFAAVGAVQAYDGPYCLDPNTDLLNDAPCENRLSIVDGTEWKSNDIFKCFSYALTPSLCHHQHFWPDNDLTPLEACCGCGGGTHTACTNCDKSVSYRNERGVCVKKSECVHYDAAAETATTDRVCVSVPYGYYAVSPTEIKPWSTCPLNTFVAVWGSATADVECHRCPENTVSLEILAPCSCAPGFQPIAGNTIPCEECPPNTYNDAVSLDECTPCSPCPQEHIVAECTATHDVICASEHCTGPNCNVCGRLARSEFARVMCAEKTEAECDACIREYSNGRFDLVGKNPDDVPVNDTVSYSDFTVEPPTFETHPHRPNAIGRPIGIYRRKTIALAHSDDFTADLYWGNAFVAAVDIGRTERVQILGPVLVWTAGSYDLETNVYTKVKNSGAWQRILVSEQHTRYFEIAQGTQTSTECDDLSPNFENISPTGVRYYLYCTDFDDNATWCIDSEFNLATDATVGLTPPEACCACGGGNRARIRWIEDGNTVSSAGVTPTEHSGIFSHSQDTATFWYTNANNTFFEVYDKDSNKVGDYIANFVFHDVRNGVANTLVGTNDTHIVVLDMHDYTVMSTYSLTATVQASFAAPSVVRGCVALGGTCSESLLCCDETHEYAKYSEPPEPTIANVAMLSNSGPPTIARLNTIPLQFKGRSSTADPISQPATVTANPVAYQSRPTPMGVKALGYNRPGGFDAFQVGRAHQ